MTSPTGLSLLIPAGVFLVVLAIQASAVLGHLKWDVPVGDWWGDSMVSAVFAPGFFVLDHFHIPFPRNPALAQAVFYLVNLLLWFGAFRAGFAAWSGMVRMMAKRPVVESRNPFAWENGDD